MMFFSFHLKGSESVQSLGVAGFVRLLKDGFLGNLRNDTLVHVAASTIYFQTRLSSEPSSTKWTNIYGVFRWWCLSLELRCLPIQLLNSNATGVQSLRKPAAPCSAWHLYGDGKLILSRMLLQIHQGVLDDGVTLSVSLDCHKLLFLN